MEDPKNVSCECCRSRWKGVFCGIEQGTLDPVESQKDVLFLKKGRILFQEGLPSAGFYCVCSGFLKIQKEIAGKTFTLRIAGPGEFLGHCSFFANEACFFTAEVLKDATVCFFDKNNFMSALLDNKTLALNVLKDLALELRRAQNDRINSFAHSVRERTADILLMLNKTNGKKSKSGSLISPPLSREDLAKLIGTSHESVTRVLHDFKEEGIVDLQKNKIFIKDQKSLLKVIHPRP